MLAKAVVLLVCGQGVESARLCYRLVRAHVACMYVCDVCVVHEVPRDTHPHTSAIEKPVNT